MSDWKPASSVFYGGTTQIQAIKGRRVRARVPLLEFNVFDENHPGVEKYSLHPGAIGLIASPHPDYPALLIAFSTDSALVLTTLDALARSGRFKVVEVNEPTFKLQFDIEA